MISLDKKMLDKESRVAKRMIEYGKEDELFILIPSSEKKSVELSNTVHVQSTGGNKLQQYFRLKKEALKVIKKNKIISITVQDPFFTANIGIWLKKKTGSVLEIQVHGDFFGSRFYKTKSLKHIVKFFIGKRNVLSADSVRVVGMRIAESLKKIGVEKSKIYIKSIDSFLSEGSIIANDSINLKKEYNAERIFVWAGRMEPVKNLSWLIDIFSEVAKKEPTFKLLLIGNGSEKLTLVRKVKQLHIGKQVHILSWKEDVISYLADADCILFPSLSEGYGLVPMEAHEVGTCIIMNDVGVANYELQPSKNVQIIPVSNRQKWIDAILHI